MSNNKMGSLSLIPSVKKTLRTTNTTLSISTRIHQSPSIPIYQAEWTFQPRCTRCTKVECKPWVQWAPERTTWTDRNSTAPQWDHHRWSPHTTTEHLIVQEFYPNLISLACRLSGRPFPALAPPCFCFSCSISSYIILITCRAPRLNRSKANCKKGEPFFGARRPHWTNWTKHEFRMLFFSRCCLFYRDHVMHIGSRGQAGKMKSWKIELRFFGIVVAHIVVMLCLLFWGHVATGLDHLYWLNWAFSRVEWRSCFILFSEDGCLSLCVWWHLLCMHDGEEFLASSSSSFSYVDKVFFFGWIDGWVRWHTLCRNIST